MKLKELFSTINKISEDNHLSKPWICGGTARDIYMKNIKNISDIDITTGNKDIHELSRAIYNHYKKTINIEFVESADTHTSIFFKNIKLDCSSNFILKNIEDIFNKMNIKDRSTLNKESFSRDFTCNSLLLDFNFSKVFDPTKKGINDIKNKIIRTVLDPSITLTQNENRVVRAIYQAVKLGFKIDPAIVDFVSKHPDTVNISTHNYLSSKINFSFKINPARTYELITKLNLWDVIPLTDSVSHFYNEYKSKKYSSFTNNRIIRQAALISLGYQYEHYQGQFDRSYLEDPKVDEIIPNDNRADQTETPLSVNLDLIPIYDPDGEQDLTVRHNKELVNDIRQPDDYIDEKGDLKEYENILAYFDDGSKSTYRIQQLTDVPDTMTEDADKSVSNKAFSYFQGNPELNRDFYQDK